MTGFTLLFLGAVNCLQFFYFAVDMPPVRRSSCQQRKSSVTQRSSARTATSTSTSPQAQVPSEQVETLARDPTAVPQNISDGLEDAIVQKVVEKL